VCAQTINIASVVDNTGEFNFGNTTAPAINDSGTVAFSTSLKNNTTGVFTVSGGVVTTIARAFVTPVSGGGTLGLGVSFPSINNAGVVAFGNTGGIYTGSGGALTTIADRTNTNNGQFDFFRDAPTINDAGTVAFMATNDASGRGLYTGTGGALTTVYNTNLASGDFLNPMINASGTVAFVSDSPQPGVQGVYTVSGGTLTTVVDNSGPFSNFFGTNQTSNPTINDLGTVAFHGQLDNSVQGIYTRTPGGLIATVADNVLTNGGIFDQFGFGAPAINEIGTVAFLASTDGRGFGIFSSLSGVASPFKLIQEGDELFGSTVTSLNFSRSGLNESNQLTFQYRLANGREGIAVANITAPVVVPEAGTLTFALPSLGMIGAVVLRRRKK
jgi:hypothetical protein